MGGALTVIYILDLVLHTDLVVCLWTRTCLWFTLGLDRCCPCAWMKHPWILNCQLYLTGSNRQRERANNRQVSKKSKHPTWLRKNSLWTCHPRWNDLTVFMKEACSHMKSMKSCETCAIDSSYLKFHVCPHPRFAGIICTYIMYLSTCLQRMHPLNVDVISNSHPYYCCEHFEVRLRVSSVKPIAPQCSSHNDGTHFFSSSSERRSYEVLMWEACPFLGEIHALLYFVISSVIFGFFVHQHPDQTQATFIINTHILIACIFLATVEQG